MVRKMARIGSERARMVKKKKKKMSEFNSLHTGCNRLCLQAKLNQGM